MGRYDYIEILSNNLKETERLLGVENLIFQQDNDPKYTARDTIDFFEYHNIELLECAPQSPDLNPIEHLWAIIKRRLGTKLYKSFDELKAAIVEILNSIPVETCQKLVSSMGKGLRKYVG